ncbi:MAG: amidohydrolase [bacterium]|nr:amidohydrolase [bacterium]
MKTRRRLITGGRVFTADPARPWATTVVIEGDRILFVGDTPPAGSDDMEETIDVAGGLVLPGFIDGHVHVAMTGASMLKAQLRGSGSLDEIRRRVRAWADEHPDEPRVLGTNWVHSDVPDAKPTRQMLDDIVPDRPVYLEAYDFHSSWVNSAALAELGIDNDTPDPIGGEIVRDPATGEATGHLLENACAMWVRPLLANVADQVREQHIVAALDAFARAGITGAVEMALEEPVLRAMHALHETGRLTARIVGHMIIYRTGEAETELAQVRRAVDLANTYRGDRLRVGGIKIIADGTIDGCTAALSAPYATGEDAEPIWDPQALDPVVRAADAAGLQIAIHAIGDEAVRIAVDALESAMRVNRTAGRRHRIEHLEYAREEEITRMGALGITASMQPVHLDPAILDHWLEVLGPERANHSFAWPLYLAAGAALAFGTDTPTAPHEALPNMYLASTRKSPTDDTLPALRPDWALPVEQAVLHGTREPAWAAWLEHRTGMLKPGLAADLVVLDRDVLAGEPSVLLQTGVRMTMMDGTVVHSS